MNGPAPESEPRHVPVLPTEVINYLAPEPGQLVVDATVGAGGHSLLLAERLGSHGRLIGLDRDQAMLSLAHQVVGALKSPVTLVHASFDRLRQVLDELHVGQVDGVLADLGVCSDQLDDLARGFSFQQEGPLDMRLDPQAGEPAATLLRRLSERELADLFWTYGEERFSRRIAKKIVETRKLSPLATTTQLAGLVRRCLPHGRGQWHRIDPATRVFQALRIAVNDELGALERFLAVLPDCLKPGGRAVIISFHSLEDRLVKRAFQNRERWMVLTKKPVQAGDDERWKNPRSRSAKLRAAVYIGKAGS